MRNSNQILDGEENFYGVSYHALAKTCSLCVRMTVICGALCDVIAVKAGSKTFGAIVPCFSNCARDMLDR